MYIPTDGKFSGVCGFLGVWVFRDTKHRAWDRAVFFRVYLGFRLSNYHKFFALAMVPMARRWVVQRWYVRQTEDEVAVIVGIFFRWREQKSTGDGRSKGDTCGQGTDGLCDCCDLISGRNASWLGVFAL